MNIYFGEIKYCSNPKQEGLATFEFDGKHFDFAVGADEDHIFIKDAVGRYVPLGHEHVIELFHVLKEILPFSYVFAEYADKASILQDMKDSCI